MRSVGAVLLAMVLVLGSQVPQSQAALSQTSPINPANGFPFWYKDSNGIALELQTAADAPSFGIPAEVLPASPFSQSIGFGPESFWWSAEASVDGTSAGRILLVLAQEAAFTGDAAADVADGNQQAFGRIRVRIDNPPAIGTYTVTHPYGTETLEAVEGVVPGVADRIFFTDDTGCFLLPGLINSCADFNPITADPSDTFFNLATVGRIGPFLTWDTFNPNPALSDPLLVNAVNSRRHVGRADVNHKVVGSPAGNNFFRVEGPASADFFPDVPGIQNVVETDLFAVTGKLADVTPPVITVNGENPVTVAKNAVYADAGATALDDIDGVVDVAVSGLPIDTSVPGINTVTYTAQDTVFNAIAATRTVNVVNAVPVANPDAFTVTEDLPRNITVQELLANDTDADAGDVLSVTAVSNPVNGTVVLAGNIATFTPAANFNGAASFEYTLSDGIDTATGNVAITVSPVGATNPTAGSDTASATEDTPLVIPAVALLANDTDPNEQVLSITAVQDPAVKVSDGAPAGTVSLAAGEITYIPALNFVGQATFTYTVSNTSGLTAIGTVTVTVSPVAATPPVLVNDAATTNEDTSITVAVLGNDIDPTNHLPLSVTAVGNAVNGTVTFTAGDVTYTPNANFNGSDTFTYTAADTIGQTSVGTVSVTVNPVNDAPAITPIVDPVAVQIGNVIDLTAVAIDVDGDPITFSLVNPPNGAEINPATGKFSWTPTAAGARIITVQASDGTLTATDTFRATANAAPVIPPVVPPVTPPVGPPVTPPVTPPTTPPQAPDQLAPVLPVIDTGAAAPAVAAKKTTATIQFATSNPAIAKIVVIKRGGKKLKKPVEIMVSDTPATTHTVTLSKLTKKTSYVYKVVTMNPDGSVISETGLKTFKTKKK